MSEKLFDALEICLQALERGETLDSALTRFPALADELRPILAASLQARQLAGAPVSDSAVALVQRRGRARLLQRAAEMREAKRAPRRRTWLFTLRPLAVTLMLVVFLLTGTGLVRASNGSLPGDNLYPVKRTWEDVTLLFASNQQHREELELSYETERVDEINELIAEGRTETVSFSGYVTKQVGDEWTVAGVPVRVTGDTRLPADPIVVGAPVMVVGRTDAQGFLVAQSIEVVAPGSIVPEIESDGDNEGEGDSDPLSGKDAGEATPLPLTKLGGVIQSISGNIWVVNGQRVDVSAAEIIGEPVPGASVIVDGYYADGVFVATKVTFVTTIVSNENENINDNVNDGNDNDRNDNDYNDNRGNDNSGNDNSGNDNSGNDND